MTEEYPVSIRLTRDRHAIAKARAAEEGVTIPRLFAQLLTEYAEREMPKPRPRAVPVSERSRTLVELPTKVRRRVEKMAKAEGRSVSEVVSSLVGEQ